MTAERQAVPTVAITAADRECFIANVRDLVGSSPDFEGDIRSGASDCAPGLIAIAAHRQAMNDGQRSPWVMPQEPLVLLSGDDNDFLSFSGDDDGTGTVMTQHRYYRWGDGCVVAIGEMNHPNIWDDEAFDAKCTALEDSLVLGSGLPDDVRALVIAGREFWDANGDGSSESAAMFAALEAFSSRVPYNDEPAAIGRPEVDWSRPLIDSHGKSVRITMTPDQQPNPIWAGHYDVRVGDTDEHRTVRADTGFTPDGDYSVSNAPAGSCILCTGKCRGHGLADPVAWGAEVGSVAALARAKASGAEAA